MIDSKKLKHFLKVAELSNFNNAATSLHISQPALSRSIQSLEDSLGIELFDRTQKKIKLTQQGQHVLTYAKQVILGLENLEREVDRLKLLETGRLSIGTGPLPAEHIAAVACTEFLNRYPQIQLSLTVDEPENLVPLLTNGELDVLFSDTRVIGDTSCFNIYPLPNYPVITVARRDHPLQNKKNLTFTDIDQFPLTTISHHTSRMLSHLFEKQYDRAEVFFSYECNSVQLLLTTIKRSNAIGILLSCNVESALKNNELCVLDVPSINEKIYSQYAILTYKSRLLSLATEKFIDISKSVADKFDRHETLK